MDFKVLLIVYLWLLGGYGWVMAYENGDKVKMSLGGKLIFIGLIPIFGIIATVMTAYEYWMRGEAG